MSLHPHIATVHAIVKQAAPSTRAGSRGAPSRVASFVPVTVVAQAAVVQLLDASNIAR